MHCLLYKLNYCSSFPPSINILGLIFFKQTILISSIMTDFFQVLRRTRLPLIPIITLPKIFQNFHPLQFTHNNPSFLFLFRICSDRTIHRIPFTPVPWPWPLTTQLPKLYYLSEPWTALPVQWWHGICYKLELTRLSPLRIKTILRYHSRLRSAGTPTFRFQARSLHAIDHLRRLGGTLWRYGIVHPPFRYLGLNIQLKSTHIIWVTHPVNFLSQLNLFRPVLSQCTRVIPFESNSCSSWASSMLQYLKFLPKSCRPKSSDALVFIPIWTRQCL